MLSWLWGGSGSSSNSSSLQLRRINGPNELVLSDGALQRKETPEGCSYEFTLPARNNSSSNNNNNNNTNKSLGNSSADIDPAWTALHTYKTDLPFALKPLVVVHGLLLPYFELQVEFATPGTQLWIGLPLAGGGAKLVHSNADVKSKNLEHDVFGEFEVGDRVGVGVLTPKDPKLPKRLFVTRNGQLLRDDFYCAIAATTPSAVDYPTLRIRGGCCRFNINLGLGDQLFAYNPDSGL